MRLRHRLLVVFLGVALVGSMLLGLATTRIVRDAVEHRFTERIAAEASLLSDLLQRAPIDPGALVAAAAAELSVRVTLIDGDGNVLHDSAVSDVSRLDNHATRPELVDAASRGTGASFRRSDSTRENYFYTAHRVTTSGGVRYVRIALPAQRVRRAQLGAVRTLWLTVTVINLGLAFAAYRAVRLFSKPVERTSEAADRIARGDLDVEVEIPRGQGELARMAEAVNRMKRAMLRQVALVSSERDLLDSVLSGMQEGLVIVGGDRRIRMANPAARRILDVDVDPGGHLLAEVVRHPSLIQMTDRCLEDPTASQQDVLRLPATGRAFDTRIAPLASPGGGAVILLFDITQRESLEEVRRQFVANVSHELRTPLTSIKAFVETLLHGAAEDEADRREFLEIIQRHADRMEALIDDITDLSRIETGAILLEPEPLALHEVAGDVVEQLRPQIESKQVEVRTRFETEAIACGDRRRLEQVLRNLIVNAVNFNHEGGEVLLESSVENGRPVFRIRDTGVGIPEADLERIFHRFYRVDAFRSREAGGTGLGLAIVKHLMRLHDGEVRVTSTLGEGSTFTLVFPPPEDRTVSHTG